MKTNRLICRKLASSYNEGARIDRAHHCTYIAKNFGGGFMMKRWRWLPALVVTVLFLTMISLTLAAPKAVKLVVWGGVPPENGPQQIVTEWNAAHPETQVEYVRFVNDDAGNTKLDVALLSGEQIDAYFTYGVPYMVKRIEGGMAEDLSKYGFTSFVKNNIGTSGIFRYKNKLYSIPTCKEMQYYMVNKNLFDQAGIAVPTAWTIDDFRAVSKKLTRVADGKTQYGVFYLPFNMSNNFDLSRNVLGTNYSYKKGGKESNFDHPIFRQEAQLFYDMMYTDKSTFPYSEVLARKLQAYAQDLLMNQEVAMMKTAPWTLRYVKDTGKYPHDWITSFTPLPTVPKVKNFYNDGALNNWLLMNSRSKYKKETAAFMKFWVTNGWKAMLVGGKIPTYNKADQDQIIDGLFGDSKKLFDVAAFKRVAFDPKMKFYEPDTITAAAPEILQIRQTEADKYFLRDETLDQFITNLKKRSDDAIRNAAQ